MRRRKESLSEVSAVEDQEQGEDLKGEGETGGGGDQVVTMQMTSSFGQRKSWISSKANQAKAN